MNQKPKSKRGQTNHKKILSRLMAVQIFYQYYFFNKERKLDEIKNDLVENYLLDSDRETQSYRDEIDENFLNLLVLGVETQIEKIDEEISKFLKGDWSLEKLEDVSLQILRLATFELKFLIDVPAKVVIGEYVDIAASFFSDKHLSFINATIDALAKNLRTTEFSKS
jgi:transcription antitermination protein NusB